jgi:Fe-S-cluster containining protein
VSETLKAWAGDARRLFHDAREANGLEHAVVTFHRRVDEAVALTVAGHGVRTACARGCSHCCHLRLEVTPAEAFTLADWLRARFAPARLAAVLERLRANAARTRELGTEGRKRTSLACALLGDDGACTAYEARPAQCRRYHSLDVAACEAFHRDPANEALESPLHPAVAHNAAVIVTQAQHAAREAGLDAEPVDMNIALLAALEHPAARRRWRDGKKPFVAPLPA